MPLACYFSRGTIVQTALSHFVSRSSYPSPYHTLSKLHHPCTVKQHPAYFLLLSLRLPKRRMACRLGMIRFTNERKSYPESPYTIHMPRKRRRILSRRTHVNFSNIPSEATRCKLSFVLHISAKISEL
jgi:hypothetical protein